MKNIFYFLAMITLGVMAYERWVSPKMNASQNWRSLIHTRSERALKMAQACYNVLVDDGKLPPQP